MSGIIETDENKIELFKSLHNTILTQVAWIRYYQKQCNEIFDYFENKLWQEYLESREHNHIDNAYLWNEYFYLPCNEEGFQRIKESLLFNEYETIDDYNKEQRQRYEMRCSLCSKPVDNLIHEDLKEVVVNGKYYFIMSTEYGTLWDIRKKICEMLGIDYDTKFPPPDYD